MNAEARTQPARDSAAVPRDTAPREERSPSLSSDALLRGQKAVTISHNGAVYRLQTTRQGKLILTK